MKGLQFNLLSPHLLASAGMDGELAIWDLSDPRQPKQYPPLKVNPTVASHSCPCVACIVLQQSAASVHSTSRHPDTGHTFIAHLSHPRRPAICNLPATQGQSFPGTCVLHCSGRALSSHNVAAGATTGAKQTAQGILNIATEVLGSSEACSTLVRVPERLTLTHART